MATRWFFLSYARNDADPLLVKFHQGLVESVCRLVAGEKEEIGFFDSRDIKPGDEWPATLADALQTCRAFAPIYSPTYFTKEYCGKEWEVFRSRVDAYVAGSPPGTKRPPVILPILWVPENRLPPLPDAVANLQYKHADFGDTYAEEGLRQLMNLRKYRDKYKEFLETFARLLIDAARAQVLPPLKELQPLKDVKSAWLSAAGQKAGPLPSSNGGPRYVQFVFVAGRRDELRPLRQKVDCYGDEGGMDWHPYLPDHVDEVAILAQDVASMENLISQPIVLDGDIIRRIEEAERTNKIVVIIVDTWTLRLSEYHNFMRDYDKRNFINCIVLVPWNEKDDESTSARSVLEDAVKVTFLNRSLLKDPNCFVDRISSPDELKGNLSSMLNKARMRIIEKTDVIRRAESGQVIAKPLILGPGGSRN